MGERVHSATGCWLAKYGVFEREPTPCEGRLVRVHLIPQRELKKKDAWHHGRLGLFDDRVWVWACGGPGYGNGGHHGQLDEARTLSIPRAVLPPALEEFAQEFELGWFLDREYGVLTAA